MFGCSLYCQEVCGLMYLEILQVSNIAHFLWIYNNTQFCTYILDCWFINTKNVTVCYFLVAQI